MVRLSVNVNKVATLRNARGGNVPNLIQVVKDCETFGAQGITVHPRPDERHIRYQDVRELKTIVSTEFNIEGYPNPSFMDLVKEVRPEQVTLVPDPPGVLTSNAGWKVTEHTGFLRDITKYLKDLGCRVSVFMDTDLDQIKALKEVGVDRVELYTEAYAHNFPKDKINAIIPYVEAAKLASEMGFGVNAGHDLSLENLAYFAQHVPSLLEVSIGHALIADALYLGLEKTIELYLQKCTTHVAL
ncbi:MAG: pyridoxine 5-phosphate synthase [Sphingobacteriales bacterium]|jgi:pyridoxine 5-phosphate synthase